MNKVFFPILLLLGLIVSAALMLGGHSEKVSAQTVATLHPDVAPTAIQWQLVTSWPKHFPGLGMAPERFADLVSQMSNGRLQIQVYGAGELVPAFGVFNAVSEGRVQMGHSASYYWKGKTGAAQFFSSIPFGMNAQQMNGWLSYGGGMALWEEVYRPFGIIPLAGGNTGMQMGGWFNKQINTMDDFNGLKIRLPGLGGEVLKRVGAVPVSLAGRELYNALQTGAVDAAEFVGPMNDLALGLNKVAKYYYYPGWHEPGSTMEFLVNQAAMESLPSDLQAIVRVAAKAINQDMLDEYTAKNVGALNVLVADNDVELMPFPPEVLRQLKALSVQVIAEQSAQDPLMQKVLDAYLAYEAQVRQYHYVTEDSYPALVY